MNLRTSGAPLALLLLVALLLSGCSFDLSPANAAPTAIPSDGPLPTPPTLAPADETGVYTGADLAKMTTAEQLQTVAVPARDLAALRLRLDPALGSIPTPPVDPPAYEVGDTLEFFVHDADSAEHRTIVAELLHRTDIAYAWVEQGQEHDAEQIRDAIDVFSTRIYPAAVTAFGREMLPGVDGDPRLHVLHTTGMGSVAGYFLGSDQNSRLALPWSNEKEMFYVSLDWLSGLPDSDVYETVLAHEFQHMIHYAHDRNEEVWINEGLSEYAQEVAGYPADFYFANSYLFNPDTQLNAWMGANANNSPHYGAAYLFVRYLVQRFDPSIARALVAESADGIEGVRRVLAQQEGAPTFEQLFGDWLAALALDQPDALATTGVFGYTELDPQPAQPIESLTEYPAAIEDVVGNFALDLIALDGSGDIAVRFDGDAATRIAPTSPANGARAWWANRSDDSDARLTRLFDLSGVEAGQPVTLTASMWWEIEPDYDFGYVMASADGVAWEILPGTRSTPSDPTTNSLGPGYTGVSSDEASDAPGWVTETFDLSAYAGGPLHLRFEYVTDDAVNTPGWFVDDVRIDAISYSDNFEGEAAGWQSEGWLLTDGALDQRWLVQLLTLDRGQLSTVEQTILDAGGAATFEVDGLGRNRNALLTISGLTEGTTEPAAYRLAIETRE